ncbi:hypothetical protein Y032_0049g1829 [Ancylostoma ceylanicum]|nr:hypothetical protein Y032_0049g1829 [Ancylostoma ceylanicum]
MGGLVSSLGEMICGNLRICAYKIDLDSHYDHFLEVPPPELLLHRFLSIHSFLCVADMVEQLKAQFEEALQKYKEIENDREKYMNSRQQLESQLTENTLVKSEFEYLDEDAKVYKLIGACLVRQDIPEARANVDKRLEYINAEIKRVDESLSDFKEKADEQKAKLLELQQKLAAAK